MWLFLLTMSVLLSAVLFVDAPAVRIESFQAEKYRLAATEEERKRYAAVLVENMVAQGLGASAVNLDGIVDRRLVEEGHRFIECLFHPSRLREEQTAPSEASPSRVQRWVEATPARRGEFYQGLAPWKPTKDEPDLGVFLPGSERYHPDNPENYKLFLRYGLRGPNRAFPRHDFFPDYKTLKTFLGEEDAGFISRFIGEPALTLSLQLAEAATLIQDALAEAYFGLGPGYFRKLEIVTGKDGTSHAFRRVWDHTTQYCQYLSGEHPHPEDILFGRHVDSSTGTLVMPSETLHNGHSEDDYRLTLVRPDGEHVRPVYQQGDFLFQVGKTYQVMMAGLVVEGILNADHVNPASLRATEHYGKRGPNVEGSRRGIFFFSHPQMDMPLQGTRNSETGRPLTARDVLSADLSAYIQTE